MPVAPSVFSADRAAGIDALPGANRRPTAEPVCATAMPSAPCRAAIAGSAEGGPRKAPAPLGRERGDPPGLRSVASGRRSLPAVDEIGDVREGREGGVGAPGRAEKAAHDLERRRGRQGAKHWPPDATRAEGK